MHKTELENDALDKLAATLEVPKRNYTTMWRMRVNGKFVRCQSGKHIWRRRGDALNALILHIENSTRISDGLYLGKDKLCDDKSVDIKYVARQLLDRGMVELVEIPIDD